jgi:hypothetical protein
VHCAKPVTHVAKGFFLLALVGFSAVILAGPVLALASAVLAGLVIVGVFATLGLAVCGLYLVVVRGPKKAFNVLCALAYNFGVGCRYCCVAAGTAACKVGRVASKLPRFAVRAIRSTGRTVAELALVAGTGAVAGGLLGLVVGAIDRDLPEAVPMNALAGGMLALAAGLTIKARELWRGRRLSAA